MWPTSTGNRTLDGAEASLVSAAILVMLDALDERLCDDDDDDEAIEPTADMQLGIAVFDSLTVPQRIATLHHIAKHLLTEESPASEETSAVDDATIAAIYSEVQDQLTIEIGLDLQESNRSGRQDADSADLYDATHWRALVLAAYHQLNQNEEEYDELGVPRSEFDASLTAWEDLIDSLASAILWDRDFELIDGFMDEEPSSARHRRRLLGIHENYFVQPPLDPTSNQTRLLLAQARSLASRRPR
jgi:hypothetical protein